MITKYAKGKIVEVDPKGEKENAVSKPTTAGSGTEKPKPDAPRK